MLENSLQADERFQDNPLECHCQTFAKSLKDDGYAERTVRDKLWLLDHLGQWLKRTRVVVTNLDEKLLKAFVKQKQRVHEGDLKALQQFFNCKRAFLAPPGLV
jgi:hypothetical protein